MVSSLGKSRVGDHCCMHGVLSVEVKAEGGSEQAEELAALAWGKWQLRVELARQSAQRTLAHCGCGGRHGRCAVSLPDVRRPVKWQRRAQAARPVVGDETTDDGRHVTATPRLDCDCESSEQGGEQSQERADAGTTCSSGFTYSRPLTLP